MVFFSWQLSSKAATVTQLCSKLCSLALQANRWIKCSPGGVCGLWSLPRSSLRGWIFWYIIAVAKQCNMHL